jgi:hypothetical protein
LAVHFIGDSTMAYLKSLTFTVAPQQIARNPKLVRRQRLIDRLEEQQKLATDPSFTVLVRRWVKDPDGIKQPVDRHRRVMPWWKADGAGNLVLVLKSGLKTLEIEKGKPGIVVGAPGRLEAVLATLVAAAKAGELDAALDAASGSGDGRGIPKRARAA